MKKATKSKCNRELPKRSMKFQAKYQHPTPGQPVVILKEMDCTQKLAIMNKLVTELRGYIEYVEVVQPENDPIFLNMDAVAKKIGMGSRMELNALLNALAG